MIRTDEAGERKFFYWRSASAARTLFELPETLVLLDRLEGLDLVFFSGITLSVLSEGARERLAAALDRVRRDGTLVAFDGNYRPAGWPSAAAARETFGRFLPLVDIALPSVDDERALWSSTGCEEVSARLLRHGVKEVAVKQGPQGCYLASPSGRVEVPVEHVVQPVDTTGAGDSFNAAYLLARLQGGSAVDAAERGNRLAAVVISERGAIIPRSMTPGLAAS
jgi:2-dehydro-3-deoxygluconokinase